MHLFQLILLHASLKIIEVYLKKITTITSNASQKMKCLLSSPNTKEKETQTIFKGKQYSLIITDLKYKATKEETSNLK